MTLPTLTVLLDDGTGTFPYDVSSYVMFADGYSYNRGRGDWHGSVTAGQLDLTFNNSTGRFTRGSTLIASPSPIKVDARIRVKETVNGTTFTRFTGYVKSWPNAWPATVVTIAVTKVLATDGQARAERRALRTMIEEEILQDSPIWYYRLNEPATATSYVDSSGNNATPLVQYAGPNAPTSTTPITFGTGVGPGLGASTCAQSLGGMRLRQNPAIVSPAYQSFMICFKRTGLPAVTEGILPDFGDAGASAQNLWVVTMTTAGKLDPLGGGATVTPNSYADGQWHVLHLVGGVLYVDGVLVLNVGSNLQASVNAPTMDMAHIAGFSTALSAGRIASHATAVLATVATTETGTARIARLAGYAGLTTGVVDSSLTNVPFADITGAYAWPTIDDVNASEVGSVFIDENGALEFHNRNRAPAKTSPDLTLTASQVSPDVQPVDDDQNIVNYLETSSSVTGVTQIVRNTTSETSHGRYTDSKTYLVSTDAEALDRGNWIVTQLAEPTTRYGSLTINLFAMTPAQAATVLTALDIDCWLRVTGFASQNAGGTTVDVQVVGFTEQASENAWSVTCNVVARSLFSAWILEDATYGVLDTTTELYV